MNKERVVRFNFKDLDKLNKIKTYLYNYAEIDNLPNSKEHKKELYKLFNDIYLKVIKNK